MNCDTVEVNASDGGVLTPYVSVKYKFHDGSISALVGAKAGFEIDNNVKLSAKGGLYMNWDSHGNPTDLGVKVSGPSIGGSFDNASLSTKDAAELQVSFAPILLN